MPINLKVVSALSGFFAALGRGNFKENQTSVVTWEDVGAEEWSQFLCLAATGDIDRTRLIDTNTGYVAKNWVRNGLRFISPYFGNRGVRNGSESNFRTAKGEERLRRNTAGKHRPGHGFCRYSVYGSRKALRSWSISPLSGSV